MNNMESVVRPFATDSISPLAAAGRRNFVDPGVVVGSFGGAGGRTVSWTFSGTETIVPPNTDNFRESSRTSVNRRVENPDDPDQFVEFCQAKRINLTPERTSGRSAVRTSTYDLSGGYHDLSGGGGRSGGRVYNYSAPTSRTCESPAPAKGCA